MGNWHRVIGIDLGTTFSAVAAYNFDRQEVRIIPNRQNEPTTPSVVYVNAQGQVSVGRAAKDKLARDPAGVILEVKRLMGETSGGRKVMAHGRGDYDPEFISAHILKELKAAAERFIGEPVHDAVITVPAYFKETQRNATREAARMAQINPLLIINEPTAAAVAYAVDSGEKQTFIVYDLGGGTFDVSIVRANSERSFDVLGTGGDANLGGGDIDQAIVDWALANLRRDVGRDLSQEVKFVGKLRIEAEKVKINLCNEQAAQDFLAELDDQEYVYRLEVPIFESMIRGLLDKTMNEVDVALASARKQNDITLDDIEAVILVGGSSKIPAVGRMLLERFGKPVRTDLSPDEVVAIGAGWMGKNFQPSVEFVVTETEQRKTDPAAKAFSAADHRDIKDVVAHSMGVGLKDDVYDILIPKDTVIPFRIVREGYSTAEDNQTSIMVPVFQGEEKRASLNSLLGTVVIDNLAPEPKGTHRFTITFGLDVNGIFEGEIFHQQTRQTKPIVLDRGAQAITEKRRIELGEMVKGGTIPLQPGAGDEASSALDQLVRQAGSAMHGMTPERQVEIQQLLRRLEIARRDQNAGEQASVVSLLTMKLLQQQVM